MNPIHSILAPTDLSALARHAVVRAALLAAELGARLSLQHVVNVGALDTLRHLIDAGCRPACSRSCSTRCAARSSALAAEMHRRHGVTPELHLAVGGVLGEIVGHAEAIDADLLVMGARGAGFMRELLIGSTTERVLRKTVRPMLVVKQIAARALPPGAGAGGLLRARARGAASSPSAWRRRPNTCCCTPSRCPSRASCATPGWRRTRCPALRVNARREAGAQMNELVARAGPRREPRAPHRGPRRGHHADPRAGAGAGLRPDRDRQARPRPARRDAARQRHQARARPVGRRRAGLRPQAGLRRVGRGRALRARPLRPGRILRQAQPADPVRLARQGVHSRPCRAREAPMENS